MKRHSISIALFTPCINGYVVPLIGQITEAEINPTGVFFLRYTTDERNATINSPLEGQCIYNTEIDGIDCYNGTEWVKASGQAMAFRAYLASPIDVNSTMDTLLAGYNEINDPYDIFNPTTDIFTAPTTGMCQVKAKLALR